MQACHLYSANLLQVHTSMGPGTPVHSQTPGIKQQWASQGRDEPYIPCCTHFPSNTQPCPWLLVFLCIYACMCIHMRGGGAEDHPGCQSSSDAIYIFPPKLFHWPRTSLIRLALLAWRGLRIPLSLPLQQWVYKPTPTPWSFLYGCWKSKSGSHACTASILPTYPSPLAPWADFWVQWF